VTALGAITPVAASRPPIDVEITRPDALPAEAWRDLLRRAPPNVFMDPAGLAATAATNYADTVMLLAWETGTSGRRLVGVWALERRSVAPWGIACLAAPPHFYAFVSSPVVDGARTDAVIAAFFAAIAADPGLPKVLRLRYLDGDLASFAAIESAARPLPHRVLSETTRAFATVDSGIKKSGSTRKKLRQDWNRLSGLGAVDILNQRDPSAVRDAFEAFLAMEKESWKGANRTALLCAPDDAAFARAFIAGLAGEGSASVALLRLDGRAIATQVVLYCGAMAYTWKTAYDAAYDRYSPGAVLIDRLAEELFASGVTALESCSPDGGFMATLWSGRRRTVDFLVDLSGRRSLVFVLVALGVRGYAGAKAARNRLRTWMAPRRTGKPKPAAVAPRADKAA
jgi:CelD/BcsL family acetyltransferase involved in cellulose biosynthesis